MFSRYRAALLVGAIGLSIFQQPILAQDKLDVPDQAESWDVGTGDRILGNIRRWTDDKGVRRSHEKYSIRGMDFEFQQEMSLGSNGTPVSLAISGKTTSGAPQEEFSAKDGRYRYRSKSDAGAGTTAGGLYYPLTLTADYLAAVAEALYRSPTRSLPLIPTGVASLEKLTSVTITRGSNAKTVTAYNINGLDYGPKIIWMDGEHFFGSVVEKFDLFYLPTGWKHVVAQLREAENSASAQLGAGLVRQFAPRLATAVAFRNVRIFDAEKLAFKTDMTVVTEAGQIKAIGRSSSIRIPTGARVIRGSGKTLIPGLWDAHFHYVSDSLGEQALAFGITNVRDLGSVPAETLLRRSLIDKGELLGPAIIPLLLIDGKGPRTAQGARVATDVKSGLEWVHYAKANGYIGVKLYGSLNPALVTPIAAESHHLGLRVQGHLPATMRPLEAIDAGYDEITHLNYLMMQAMPKSVVDESNSLLRLQGPGRYFGEVALDRPPMTTLLDKMQAQHIASDTTIAGFEGLWVCNPGQFSAAEAPWRGKLPPLAEREALHTSCNPPPGSTNMQLRASFTNAIALIRDMHRRGIDIVAGTDAMPIDLVRDIELFHQAGMTQAAALAAATIVPARLSGMDRITGSIKVGKRADLVLVDGDPSTCLGDLRRVELVLRDNRLMQANQLRSLVSLRGIPAKGCSKTALR